MWGWLQGNSRKAEQPEVQSVIRSDDEYLRLLQDLLDRLAVEPGYATLMAWSIIQRVKEGDLAVWLLGVAEQLDDNLRERLELLVSLRRGNLSLVAEEVLGVAKTTIQDFNSDDAEEWFKRGYGFFEEGRFEEAIKSYDCAISINPNHYKALSNRGSILCDYLRKYDAALPFFDQAVSIKPDQHESWHNRGVVLNHLGKYEEAIESYDRAIMFKPDFHEAWSNRATSLHKLGKYEEAIASCDQSIAFKPSFHEAWYSRGISLGKLCRHEEAVESCDQAIVFKPDSQEAWSNRGVALDELGKYEEAIASYDQAIYFKPDSQKAWSNRGNSLNKLGRYKEAIESCDRAISLKPDRPEAWYVRGVALGNLGHYEEAIKNFQQGLSHLRPTTHPEGWGKLYQWLGRLHYHKGKNNFDKFCQDSGVYYRQALDAFQEATTTLPKFPELHLELIQDFMKVYSALRELEKANSYLEQGRELLKQLLNDQLPRQRRKLLTKFNGFRQIEVDILLQQQQPVLALVAAELCKNFCLENLLSGLQENIVSPSFSQIQTLLQPHRAIIYWHLSPSALTTFILLPNLTTPNTFCNYNLTELQDWITQWDKINTVADSPETTNSKKKNHNTPLAPEFAKINWPQLQQILEISKIQQHLDQIPHITNLILIPHKDLHRLPLHQFFNHPVTHLPSLQIALNLQQKALSTSSLSVDLIHPPQGSDLSNAEVEIATIRALLPTGRSLASSNTTKPEFLEFIGNDEKQGNTAKDPHPQISPQRILHFTGHSQHFARRPQESCLYLNQNQTITCPDLATSNLTPYHLIILSACQTSIVHHQTLSDEYIGLVSACLSGGASYTISTLWEIADSASSPFFIYFYQQLAQNILAPQALHNASQWLRNVTNAQLIQFYTKLQQHPNLSHQAEVLEKIRVILLTLQTLKPTDRQYQDPYYWAVFTISGIAPQPTD
jgi:tetratricopeptide (TPR) repeat protein